MLYAVGLPFVGISRVLVQGFYALEDTRTPVAVGVVSVLAFAGAAALLTPRFGHLGIAGASSTAALLNAGVNLLLLRRKVGRLGLTKVAVSVAQLVPALAALAAAAFFSAGLGDWAVGASGLDLPTLRNVAVLALAVSSGAIAYAGGTLLLGHPEARTALAALRRRLGR